MDGRTPPRSVPQSRAATPAPGDEPVPAAVGCVFPKVIQQDSRYLPAYGSANTAAKPLIGMSGRLGQSAGSVRSVRGHQARCQRARPSISADLARTPPWLPSPKVTSAGESPGFARNTPGRFS